MLLLFWVRCTLAHVDSSMYLQQCVQHQGMCVGLVLETGCVSGEMLLVTMLDAVRLRGIAIHARFLKLPTSGLCALAHTQVMCVQA